LMVLNLLFSQRGCSRISNVRRPQKPHERTCAEAYIVTIEWEPDADKVAELAEVLGGANLFIFRKE